mgnify:CR=1 FL=1
MNFREVSFCLILCDVNLTVRLLIDRFSQQCCSSPSHLGLLSRVTEASASTCLLDMLENGAKRERDVNETKNMSRKYCKLLLTPPSTHPLTR